MGDDQIGAPANAAQSYFSVLEKNEPPNAPQKQGNKQSLETPPPENKAFLGLTTPDARACVGGGKSAETPATATAVITKRLVHP